MSEVQTNDVMMNTLIVVSEIAAIFAVIIFVALILSYRKRKNQKRLTVEFLEDIKTKGAQREQEIKASIDETTTLEDEAKAKIIEGLVNSEKKAYVHIAQLFLGYKPDSLMELEAEIKDISGHYVSVIKQVAKNPSGSGEGDDVAIRELKKQVTQLREEKKSLKEKNFQLQSDFDASMDTIESMTSEFANMYEGGSKDGEKKIKNEMYQLRQTLSQKKEYTEADDGEGNIPELAVSDDADASPVADDNSETDDGDNAEVK